MSIIVCRNGTYLCILAAGTNSKKITFACTIPFGTFDFSQMSDPLLMGGLYNQLLHCEL